MKLSEANLNRIKALLTQREQAVVPQLREQMEHPEARQASELVGQVRDSGDDALAETLASLGVTLADHELQELRDIESARQRINSAAYGSCVDCGSDIDLQRLFAYPTAKRCIDCQRRHERIHKGHAAPSL